MDDASLIGTADDVLLPIVAIGLLATQLLTHAAPSVPDLAGAWKDVTVAMEAVGQEAERVKQEAARARSIPARRDCQKHLNRCLETPLGKPNTGSTYGKSICVDCFEYCRGQGQWHDSTGASKDCRWWEWLGMATQGKPMPGAGHE